LFIFKYYGYRQQRTINQRD